MQIDSSTSVSLIVIIACAGILGSGLASYVGVHIALAEVKTELKRLDKIEGRLDRLEDKYFK